MKKVLFIFAVLCLVLASCKKEISTPTPENGGLNQGNGDNNQCNIHSNIYGKLYSQYKDTSGTANNNSVPPNTSLPTFFSINDSTRSDLIYFEGTYINNQSEKLYYKVTDYDWYKNYLTDEWYLETWGEAYFRIDSDCKFYVPISGDGTRVNYFNMSGVAYNQGMVSNHVQFIDMIDSIYVVNMFGDGIGSGNDDVYERDSIVYYLVN